MRVTRLRFHGLSLVRFLQVCTAILVSPTPILADDIEGLTEPFRTVRVASAEFGIIELMNCQQDDVVRRDQILAKLDSRLLEARSRVAHARTKADGRVQGLTIERGLRAKRLAGLKELFDKGRASAEEVDRAEADLAIAESNFKAVTEEHDVSRLEWEEIKEQIERRTIRSPLDGVVSSVECEAGEYLAAHDPAVLTLVQVQPLRIVVHVAPRIAAKTKVADLLHVCLQDEDETVKARVDRVSPVCDPESGTVRVQLLLDNTHNRWRSGIVCRVSFPDGASDTHASSTSMSVTNKPGPTHER